MLRYLSVLFFLLFLGAAVVASEQKSVGSFEYSLKRYEGKKSLLILFAPNAQDEKFKTTLEGVLGRYEEFRKKSLGVFYVFENEVGRADDMKLRPQDGSDLRKRMKVSSGEFRAVFLDKKGKVRRESSEPMTKSQLDQFLGF